ncbi:MAG: hypothetical protein N3D11_02340 [Candidatus Sumerlaeia bacterium]|nr:hypothetical protein [Candidatus Sumerlaeia bacterium]
MASELTPVACPFEDCLYYVRTTVPTEPVCCSHPDKRRFHGSQACPLYQYNWMKRLTAAQK